MVKLRTLKRVLGLTTALLVAAPHGRALAESTAAEKAAAEALFDQARQLTSEGRYPEACRKFEQSQGIDPGIGTMLYLADCYEKDGRTASAWALFREASSAARAAGQEERAKQGASRADHLEPTLSQLTVVVDPDAIVDGMVVRRGPQTIPRSIWGVAVPVDPGSHRIQVEAPGYRPWAQTVTVGKNAARTSVKVPRLEPDPTAVTPAPAPAEPAVAQPTPQTPPPADSTPDGRGQRIAGFTLGGVGIVGLAVGTAFGIRALSKNKDAEKFCSGATCQTSEGITLTEQAQDAATIANIGVIGGAVLLAGGVTLILTAPKDSRGTALRVQSHLAQGGGSVSLSGAF